MGKLGGKFVEGLPVSPGCRVPMATMCSKHREQRGRGLRQFGQLVD